MGGARVPCTSTIGVMEMNTLSQKIVPHFADWFRDGPWRSKSVLSGGRGCDWLGFWIADIQPEPPQDKAVQAATQAPQIRPVDTGSHWNWGKPFPFYVRMGASYAAAYCIGWLLRRLIRLILLVGALGVALLGFGKLVGWNMTPTQEHMEYGSAWARREATAERDYLTGLLPSATAGGFGIFMGLRRRNRTDPSEPAA